jgi:pimeloyl-ACP methyl ester carboxylesterase
MHRVLWALALAASLCFSTPAVAAPAAPRTFDVGAVHVSVSGSAPRAVILLPGLATGPYEFDGIRPQLEAHYTVYSVAFAGYDGRPPVQAPYLDAFVQGVLAVIVREHLRKPILIGHSLGGHVAVRIAETQPDRIGAVLAIDALPLFPPARPGETPDARKAAWDAFRAKLLALSADDYAAQTKRSISFLVSDPANVALVAGHDIASDRATVAGSAREMALDDLTPLLPKIGAPLEVLVPSPGDDAAAAQTAALYAKLYEGTRDLTVVPIANSKHFVMFDQPAAFASAVTAFLARVAP